jgi:hypothetical protein
MGRRVRRRKMTVWRIWMCHFESDSHCSVSARRSLCMAQDIDIASALLESILQTQCFGMRRAFLEDS